MYYFAYGSNLNLKEMKRRVLIYKKVGIALLNDYKLSFKGSYVGYLTLDYEKGAITPVGIYKIPNYALHKLDIYEGYPYVYDRCNINVRYNGKIINGVIYIMNKEFDFKLPDYDYVKRCLQGYNDFNLNPVILENALEFTKNIIDNSKKR